MNNNDRKKLVWKYFWEQKWEEIKAFGKFLCYAFVMLIGLRYIPYFIGLLISKVFPSFFNRFCNNMINGVSCENTFMNFWAIGCFPSIIIILLIMGLYLFITENWEEANKRVNKELRNKK